MANCERCNAPDQQLAVEQDVYKHLIDWLNAATCIKWYYPWQDVRRPDAGNGLEPSSIRDEQYGIVVIREEDDLATPDGKPVIHEYTNGFCVTFTENVQVNVELHVYRQSGKKEGAQEIANTFFASARDILTDVRRKMRVPYIARSSMGEDYSKLLLNPKRFDQISPSWEIVTTRAEWRCEMTVTFNFCRRISYPVEVPDVACVKICEHDELLCGTINECV